MAEFWKWFDQTTADAAKSEVGKAMTAAGFHVAHTGGGCLVWEKTLPGGEYLWVCDEGNGLGTSLDEDYMVGLYAADAEPFVNDGTKGVEAALAWCAERTAEPGKFLVEVTSG